MEDDMTEKCRAIFAVVVGVPAIIAFGYFTNEWAAVSLFFVMFADNVSKG